MENQVERGEEKCVVGEREPTLYRNLEEFRGDNSNPIIEPTFTPRTQQQFPQGA